jgi:hypothetical protein
MVDANTGYCTMNQSGRPLYRTTNGGVNWTALTTGLTGSLRGVTAPDANTVYVATNFRNTESCQVNKRRCKLDIDQHFLLQLIVQAWILKMQTQDML